VEAQEAVGTVREVGGKAREATGQTPAASVRDEDGSGPDSVPSWEPPPETVRNVRRELARRWGVCADDLALEWGLPRGDSLPPGFTGVELVGRGRGGHWVVSLYRPRDPAETYAVSLRAGVEVREAVARRGMARGERLTSAHVEWRPRVSWGAPPLEEARARTGWVAQRRIRPGEVLEPPALRPPLLVASGEPVEIRWAGKGVAVTLAGRAVGSASMGERVAVRTEAGKRLFGVVAGEGVVLISSGNETGESRR
jgi:flagella basal body P-ring formation protein FlgA